MVISGNLLFDRRTMIAAVLATGLALTGCGSSGEQSSGTNVAAANLDGSIEKPNLTFRLYQADRYGSSRNCKRKGILCRGRA